ncbi:MAG: radical SAM protein [Nanoarchaeota archaeon]|nr:radical SAM protein [Nanoarchaeota archaeon]
MNVKKFVLTGKCNLKCEACFNKNFMKNLKDISLEEILFNVQPGDDVYLSGGEPMLYPLIADLSKKLLDVPVEVVISTNGIIYRKISKGVQMQVSLWTTDYHLYHKITKGTKKQLEKVKENIPKYLQDGHTIFINMPIYEKNLNEINKVSDYANQLNIPLRVNPIYPANGFKVDNVMLNQIEDSVFKLKLLGRDIIYSKTKQKVQRHFCK